MVNINVIIKLSINFDMNWFVKKITCLKIHCSLTRIPSVMSLSPSKTLGANKRYPHCLVLVGSRIYISKLH